MSVKKPTIEQLKKIAEGFNLNVTDEDLSSYQGMIQATQAIPLLQDLF
ncbi:hypothetical protein PP175_22725 [Aneurinibacillus sp. Ricciae_BoGa-3]|nr:hypothetical protein [Aneurinibacillus sp. Ricciae_BoGa-3]WCK54090.1 hypothetical protein PP175_22725 [Aneurinibacillus sp. Ricciae_BoGa-3]